MERSLVDPAISPISSSSPSIPKPKDLCLFALLPWPSPCSPSSEVGLWGLARGGAEPVRSIAGLSSMVLGGTGPGLDLASSGTGRRSTSISLPRALDMALKSNPAVLGIFLSSSSSSLAFVGDSLPDSSSVESPISPSSRGGRSSSSS